MNGKISLGALFRIALYYGFAGFGGGYSVLAQLRRDLVDKKRWLSADDFLAFAELSKSLPGTPSTNLLALLGQRVAGLRGGILAASAFLFPSMVLMIACGAAYSVMRSITGLSTFFDGMNAAMVGVVGWVTVDLGRSALKSKRDVFLAVGCAVLLATRIVSEPILAGAAVLIGAIRGALTARPPEPPRSERLHGALAFPLVLGGSVAAITGLVRVFVPIGVMTFGGGLAMIPAIEHMVVIEQGWLDPKAFADAIALGQITPGPVAICATFIGYRVAGIAGALVATVAMFAPATALAMAAGHFDGLLPDEPRHRGDAADAGAGGHRHARRGDVQPGACGGGHPRRCRDCHRRVRRVDRAPRQPALATRGRRGGEARPDVAPGEVT